MAPEPGRTHSGAPLGKPGLAGAAGTLGAPWLWLLLLSAFLLVGGHGAETTLETTQKESDRETTTDAPPGTSPLPPSESDPSEPSSFQCDAISILGNGHDVTLHRCTGGTCYATDIISACGGYGTQCCAPRISLCASGATCFATVQIETCMPWAVCCAPKVTTCLSPSCSQNFPACTQS
ncbi:unnamed protein product [Symbiodinium sp. KB8]|nr:unnamed protein product [Symbiodinium sp. KB8]